MKKVLICSVLTISILLTGCDVFDPDVVPTKIEDAQEIADSFKYVKAKNGVCYGVTTTNRLSTNATVAYNNLVVAVDCSKVGL